MDRNLRESDARRQLADQAAEWLFRLDDASPNEKRAFVRWLKSSKDAPDEVLLAKSTDIVLRQLLRDQPLDLADLGVGHQRNVTQIDTLQGSSTAPSSLHADEEPAGERIDEPRPRRVGRRAWTSIIGVGIAAALAVVLINPVQLRDWLWPNTYATSVGEQRAIELADGSAISINAKSKVRVAYSQNTRDIFLESGQAMFTVAKDASRPFRVHAGSSIVQAIGTKFDVRRSRAKVQVAVVEGTVQIIGDAVGDNVAMAMARLHTAIRVAAGEGVSVLKTGITAPTKINVADVSAWQQRRLVFRDNTLAEIAEEFSRYNRRPHIRIEGDALRARRFSGVFDADAPEALLTYLAEDDSIAFDGQGDEIIIRPRPIIVQSDVDAR